MGYVSMFAERKCLPQLLSSFSEDALGVPLAGFFFAFHVLRLQLRHIRRRLRRQNKARLGACEKHLFLPQDEDGTSIGLIGGWGLGWRMTAGSG
eukprot:m.660799 g.660799  ORF g.660799 m.660799 type:complete len:94 (-) comp58458_c0_seq1:1503-1784(-)